MKKSNMGKKLKPVLFHLFAATVGFFMVYPLLWTVASSFKHNSEIFVNSYSLVPERWAIAENYTTGWKGISGISFGTFLLNSFIVSALGTIGGVLCSMLAAYAFSRVKFIGRNFWFMCVIITLMVPNQVMIVPQYIIFKRLDLINKLQSLIIPWFFGSAFFIFLMVQFIRGIPVELDEAATIDGCGKLSIFFRIILPLLTPAIATCTIFSFYWIWQDFFQPLIFMSKPKYFTVSLALNMYLDPNSFSNYGALFAMSVVSVLPVIVLFIMFQKYLVEGIATTGLKG